MERIAASVRGKIVVEGAEVLIERPEDAVLLGLGLMAQDRRDCLIAEHSVQENIGIASLDKDVRNGNARPRRCAASRAGSG